MKVIVFIALAYALAASPAYSEIVPTLSTRELTASADVIIIGAVTSVRTTASGTVSLRGIDYPSQDFAAEIVVDDTVKGDPLPRLLTLSYTSPSADDWGNVAHGALSPGTYVAILLRKTPSGFKFVSPYSPSLPVSPKRCVSQWQAYLGGDTYRDVLNRILSALCTDASIEQKRRALLYLNWTEDSPAAPFLNAALKLPDVAYDPDLRIAIVSHLLHWHDLSVLPVAEEDLFNHSLSSSMFPKSNLILAASSLPPTTSVPLLARVLQTGDPNDRLNAARFLEYTESLSAIDVLLSDLDDSDRDVQFAIMQSLGNLTKQHQWRPGNTEVNSDWSACVDHWRAFALQQKPPN